MGHTLGVLCAIAVSSATPQALRNAQLAPYLDDSARTEIRRILDLNKMEADLESAEKTYQTLVQRQVYADLAQIYDPANEPALQVVYPSFAPERGDFGHDLGFGFHVVKRLVLPAVQGRPEKVIEVNEHWPENVIDGGLLLPDEIRIKTLVSEGERYQPGSEKLYLFDSLRLAWDEADGVAFHRRTVFDYDPKTRLNSRKRVRVSVSSPYACVGCHQPTARFADRFLQPGETRNFEAIVQQSHFALPYDQMFGYRDYIDYLKQSGHVPSFIEKVRAKLDTPTEAFRVPNLFEHLTQRVEADTFSWLGADLNLGEGPAYPYSVPRQGVYRWRGTWYIDALEENIVGKNAWWVPRSVVP